MDESNSDDGQSEARQRAFAQQYAQASRDLNQPIWKSLVVPLASGAIAAAIGYLLVKTM
jgi:hypothetical protein